MKANRCLGYSSPRTSYFVTVRNAIVAWRHSDCSAETINAKEYRMLGQRVQRFGYGPDCRRSAVVGLLLLCQFTAALAQTKDVAWLEEVRETPINPPREGIGNLVPLLADANGQAITTREGWERQRTKVRDDWRKFLGPMPEPRPAVKLERLKAEFVDHVLRTLVRYEGEPGLFVEGYLLQPIANNETLPRPGIVALHQTTNASIDEVAGVSGPESMQIGLKLAKRGFIVFCPRCFLWQSVPDYTEAVARHRERHPNSLGMAKMLYDAVRGVDVLVSLPDVDAKRIGAVGHSLGAKKRCTSRRSMSASKRRSPAKGGPGFAPRTGTHRGTSARRSATKTFRSIITNCWH